MTSGELWIRDAAEPALIEAPTTISGVNTDGQLSDVVFDTPTISFVQEVPNFSTQAFIDAVFTMVEPGSGTVNEDGDVVVNIAITVDLHIVVPLLAFPSDCRATPVDLTLTSTAPYDGESVTLTAPNFSVPEVPDTPACLNLVAGAVNNALMGGGHSLSMAFTGDLTLPLAGEPTTTTLEVTPATGTRVGQDVTLTAAVEPAEEPAEPVELPGVVTFFNGATTLGAAPLDADGRASVTTATLTAGTRNLRVVYSGAPPDWQPSSSPVVAYQVTAAPLVSTDLAGGVVVGGAAKDFTVTVRNTGLGADLDDVRLDVKIHRTSGSSVLSSVGLAHVVDGTPVPVTLTGAGVSATNQRTGSIESDIWAVPPGQERTETLRLTVPAGTGPGPVRVVLELVTVEGGEDAVLSSATGDVTLTGAARYETTITAGFGSTPPVTPVVRQGTVIEVYGLTVGPEQADLDPTGTFSFRIGGRPALARRGFDNSLVAWAPTAPIVLNSSFYHVVVPEDLPAGEHLVQVRYSGDDVYAGSVASWPVTVEPALGQVYDCIYGGIRAGRFLANVQALAQVPPVAVRGSELAVTRVEVRMFMSRTNEHVAVGTLISLPGTTNEFGLTGGGGGAFTALTQSGHSPMNAAGDPPVDWAATLIGDTATLPVDHDAGTTRDIALESLVFTADGSGLGLAFSVSCQPFDERSAVRVASVTSTGTSLAVDPVEAVVRQGDSVELTAQVLPASPGVVEFLDGEATVGVAPVDGDGIARVTVADLPPGTRSLTARSFGTVYPESTSDPVELTVEAIDCFAFAEAGSAAVVRLVYLTVLGRCPDQAGFAYWVERLDGGASREAMARSIAASQEARRLLVDDAYQLMLGRNADAAGREYWATRLGQTGSYRDLVAHLGASSEFRTLAGGTDAAVVARLYDRLLHRSPTAGDTAFWTGQIGARGLGATVTRLFDLDEPLRTLVADTYQAILGRAPTGAESDAGVSLMRATSDRSALNARVIASSDFLALAQTFPNPT